MINDIPIKYDVDILVCGGGPAGIGAAISAGRMGAKTMLCEAMDCLGGIATAGMMSHWGGRSSSGILPELMERTYKLNEEIGDNNGCDSSLFKIPQDTQKIVLDDMFKEANVKVLFYTLVCDTIVEDKKITGVVIQNKSGRAIIKAKVIVDATGDGDVAYYAGVPFIKGRETDGKMQPCTLMFKIGGVDFKKAILPGSFEDKVDVKDGEIQSLAKEHLPFPAGHVLLYSQPSPGTVCCNMTNMIDIDGTDAENLTKGLQICRSQIPPIIKFLRKYAPGYEHCWLMSTGSLLGIRETRHFKGMESLAPDDILNARLFDNWVVKRAYFNFDVHNLTGASLDKTGVQRKWKQKKDYSIPYGCLLPENIDNLLLSGRNISGSHLAHSNFRIMSVCIALGEAAGTAAALAFKNNKTPKEIDAKEIQKYVSE